MPSPYPAALALSRSVLRVLIVLNLLCVLVIGLMLIGSFAFQARLAAHFGSVPGGVAPMVMINGLRLLMMLGLAMIPPTHIVLGRLLAIVETVRGGDPFVADNAQRLSAIAWALLGLQLLDLAFGAIALGISSDNENIGWSFSIVGWVGVLLLMFVLARVFDQGARMREELEGTV